MRRAQEQGFLLIAAIVVVVILSFFALVITDLFVSDTQGAVGRLQSTQALFLAEAGLERSGRALLSPTVYSPGVADNRTSCPNVGAAVGGIAEGSGAFAVTASTSTYSGDPTHSALTLGAGVSSTATMLPLTNLGSLPDYAGAGRVLIDTEAIDYSAIAQSTTVCGGAAACLIGAVRGVDGTAALAHGAGTPLGQSQCTVQVAGSVPPAGPAVRRLAAGVAVQEGWAVGSVGSGGTELLRWVGDHWSDASSLVTGVPTLNGVACLSYADCWAVGSGSFNSTQAVALHWNGAVWRNWSAQLPGIIGGDDLDKVACTGYADCWFVGALLGGHFALVHMTGGGAAPVFTQVAPGAAGAKAKDDLDGIACVDPTLCWAVGSLQAAKTVLLEWNGARWQNVTKTDLSAPVRPNNDLDAVTCVTGTCWAVGSVNGGNALILEWTAASGWAQVTAPATLQPLDVVSCRSATDCWAAGSYLVGPTLAHWDGTAWTDVTATLPGSVTGEIDGISCTRADDCWAVGSLGAGTATLVHWDGVTWTDWSGAVGGADLEGLTLLGPGGQPQSAWSEVYP